MTVAAALQDFQGAAAAFWTFVDPLHSTLTALPQRPRTCRILEARLQLPHALEELIDIIVESARENTRQARQSRARRALASPPQGPLPLSHSLQPHPQLQQLPNDLQSHLLNLNKAYTSYSLHHISAIRRPRTTPWPPNPSTRRNTSTAPCALSPTSAPSPKSTSHCTPWRMAHKSAH